MSPPEAPSPPELPGGGRRAAVLGAGTMGHGIAQVLATAGYQVRLYDSHQPTLDSALDRVAASLAAFVAQGMLGRPEADAALQRIATHPSLGHACQGAGLVIEAVPEDPALKREIFARVEEIVAPQAAICTNTSGLSITVLAQGLAHPGRLVGAHFWNPAQVLPCVEVVMGEATDPAVFERVVDILKAAGKEPVRVKKDVPGFLGNRLQHALQREALYLVEAGIAEPEDVDRVVKHGFGLRYAFMGPLERADLGGLDVTCAVQRYLLKDLDARTESSPLLEERVARGDLGLKTGRGFYDWPPETAAARAAKRDRALLGIIKLLRALEEE